MASRLHGVFSARAVFAFRGAARASRRLRGRCGLKVGPRDGGVRRAAARGARKGGVRGFHALRCVTELIVRRCDVWPAPMFRLDLRTSADGQPEDSARYWVDASRGGRPGHSGVLGGRVASGRPFATRSPVEGPQLTVPVVCPAGLQAGCCRLLGFSTRPPAPFRIRRGSDYSWDRETCCMPAVTL